MAKINIESTISQSWTESHRISCKGTADYKHTTMKEDLPFSLNFANNVTTAVFDRWQGVWKFTGAGLISTCRDRQCQCLMRSLEVVYHPPLIEMPLSVIQIRKGFVTNEFHPQGAVKAFVLSQSFGMTYAGMTDSYPQPNQPDRKFSIAILLSCSPRLTIIAQDAVGQSVSAKQADQVGLNNLPGFSWTGKKSQGIPRMVVLNRQGMTSEIVLQGKVSLEVHLPQEIGHWSFEPLPGGMLGRFRRINTSMPVQNCRNGAGTGQGLLSSIGQPPLDFASTPSRVSMSYRQNILFFVRRGSIGTGVRASRTIPQSLLSFFSIPMKPFITRFRTDFQSVDTNPAS